MATDKQKYAFYPTPETMLVIEQVRKYQRSDFINQAIIEKGRREARLAQMRGELLTQEDTEDEQEIDFGS